MITLSKNEIAILQVLMASDNYHSSYEIASLTGISRRSVRNFIPNIKTFLQTYGIELQSQANKGYRVSIKDPALRANLISELSLDNKNSAAVSEDLLSRHIFIMRSLIQSDTYIRADDLADQLMLSRSAINPLIKEVRKLLKKNHLSLEQKPHYGLKITGEESGKRQALNDFYFTALWDSQMFYDWLDVMINEKQAWEYEIITILQKQNIYFTDIALCDLLLGISIQIERINRNLVLENDKDVDSLQNSGELEAAIQIAKLFEDKGICQMPAQEIHCLAAAIACKRSINHLSIQDPKAKDLSIRSFQMILDKTGVDLRQSINQHHLEQCIGQLLQQVHYHEKIRTEIWDVAFTRFPLAYYFTQMVEEILEQELSIRLGVSQKVYLTEIFQNMMDTIPVKKLNALLICGHTDAGQDTFAKRLETAFDGVLHVQDVISYYQLSEMDLDKYDVLISTMEIHKKLSIPYVCISSQLSKQDLDKLESFLHNRFPITRAEVYLHPLMYHEKVDVHTLKDVFKICMKDIENVYQKSISLSNISEKNVQMECVGNTLCIKTNHHQQVSSAWIVMHTEDFVFDEYSISRIIFYFGDPSSWAYRDLKRILTRKIASNTYTEFIHDLQAQ